MGAGNLVRRAFEPKFDMYGRPKKSLKQNIDMIVRQGIENSVVKCKDFSKLREILTKLMRKIPSRKLRKLRSGKIYGEQQVTGIASLIAYKVLQCSLRKESGVRDILYGEVQEGESSRGLTVVLADFGELRCTFINVEMADAFVKYMSEFYEVYKV